MTNVLPPAKVPAKAAADESVRETIGMRKWMRLTARKHSASKRVENDASKAAADALAVLLRDARKIC